MVVYILSDNSEFEGEDLYYYLRMFKSIFPEKRNWTFDEITGGIEEFNNPDNYYCFKNYFDNLK